MVEINPDFFIKESDTVRVLENITKYCSRCYKELSEDENIYLNIQYYEYICSQCACCLSEEIKTNQECTIANECIEDNLFTDATY